MASASWGLPLEAFGAEVQKTTFRALQFLAPVAATIPDPPCPWQQRQWRVPKPETQARRRWTDQRGVQRGHGSAEEGRIQAAAEAWRRQR